MAANNELLGKIHELVAQSFEQRLNADIRDEVPTDAATLGAAIKFLKDNDITSDPATDDSLKGLRTKMAEQTAQRRAAGEAKVIALRKEDEDQLMG